MEIIDIQITDEMLAEAKEYEEKTREKHKGKFTKFDTEYDYLTGKLGELAFEEYLVNHLNLEENEDFAPWKWDEDIDEIKKLYDKWDFKINKRTIDVKTERTKYQPNEDWCYGYPVIQNPHKKDYVIIGLFNFEAGYIRFVGGISGQKVSKYPSTFQNCSGKYNYKISNHDIPQKDLTPTSQIIQQILKDKTFSSS